MIALGFIAVLAAIGFPYVWGKYHCMRMLRRLRTVGEAHGFRIRRLRRFSFRNFSPYYDLLLIGEDRIYCIQLLSCYHRGRELVIRSDGRVRQRSGYRQPLEHGKRSGSEDKRFVGAWKAVPKTRLPNLKDAKKEVIPILLNYPSFEKIFLQNGRELVPYDGGRIFEKIICTPSAFEKMFFR